MHLLLDPDPYFYDYRTMERLGSSVPLDAVLTDDVLNELKRLAPEGCVQCALDKWDEGDDDGQSEG